MIRSILSEIHNRAADQMSPDHDVSMALEVLVKELIKDCSAHLTQIAVQHHRFDIHDEKHSAAVVGNMECLLGDEGIAARNIFELFLLALSAYAHDCAMALPQWELDLLKLTEGVAKEAANESLQGGRNDLKPKFSFEQARRLVRDSEKNLCGSFSEAMKWLFSPKNEQAFVDDLAERLRDYQEFRNGFAEELRELVDDSEKFASRSEELRQDFIRITHWRRIERWCRNLDHLFNERLGGKWGAALAHDLGSVCRSHGESDEFIGRMSDRSVYTGSSSSNLRFVSMMLRLGDIIHFTPDRAPLILFREKMIASPLSRQHWDVKNEGISYTIEQNEQAVQVVRYSAYFQVPSLYFMFHEYMGWIDHELALYQSLFGRATSLSSLPRIHPHVDRCSVRHDDQKFQPVPGLKFTLNQKRVLDLLMGVRLYQDKFACLRELYQNSLDACRCAIAASGVPSRTAVIEFGVGKDADSNAKYLYCRDTGIGMTRDIVSRFLLQIGTSFYKSSEFQQLATSWKNSFTPTSQFGVGILSCFMIGHRMEIVSVPMPGLGRDS